MHDYGEMTASFREAVCEIEAPTLLTLPLLFHPAHTFVYC